jgi:hypothetical protein
VTVVPQVVHVVSPQLLALPSTSPQEEFRSFLAEPPSGQALWSSHPVQLVSP